MCVSLRVFPRTGWVFHCFTFQRFEAAGCVCPQTGQVHPLPPPPPVICFHPCHTKVLICIHSHVSLCACPQVNRRTIVVSTLTTLAFSIECRYVCPHFGQACSCPLTTLGICYLGWCVWVRSSVVHLLRALVVPWSVGLCLSACCAAFFSCCYGAPLFRCCCSVFCGGCRLFGVCPCDFGACGLACSLLVPPPPPLVVSWRFLAQ